MNDEFIKDFQADIDRLQAILNLHKGQKEGPEEGEECYVVYSDGEIVKELYSTSIGWQKNLKQGNLFYPSKHTNPKEAAQMHALRVESLGWGEVIEDGQLVWIWNEISSNPVELVGSPHWLTRKFHTKERCQKWGDRFAKSWEYFNNPDNFIK